MINILWNSCDAAIATGGKNTCNWVASGVSIDTRTLEKGDIFMAIADKRDGHDYVVEAFKRGAAVAVVSKVPSNLSSEAPLLIVQDVKLALASLASFGRRRFFGKVIAITGSVGKTSTKDMLATTLSDFGKVFKAEKSFNNHLGVPLTLARTPPTSDFLVVEIGMSNKKEIAPLSELAKPNVALITDVSEAHLASFNNVIEIAKEKSDICQGLSREGLCVVSRDSQKYAHLTKYIKRFGVKTVSFGQSKNSNYKLIKTSIKSNKTCATAVLKNGLEFFFKVNSTGVHHAKNALGVIAVLDSLELDITQGLFALSNWSPTSGRGLITHIRCDDRYLIQDFTIIDETYNANPASVIAAFKALVNFSSHADDVLDNSHVRRIAILGDMLELGPKQNKKHADLAEKIDFDGIDVVHCVGDLMNCFYKKVPDRKKGKWFRTVKELSSAIANIVKDRDIIMVKASNGVGLDFFIRELKAMGNLNK